MESVDWSARIHSKSKNKDELDGLMDDYDEVMSEMASKKGNLAHDGHVPCV
jgi:hypothetical protein